MICKKYDSSTIYSTNFINFRDKAVLTLCGPCSFFLGGGGPVPSLNPRKKLEVFVFHTLERGESSGIQITETVSFDHCPVMDHETIPSSLNQSYALVSSYIQEDAIVNQNLEASLEGFA